MGQHELHEYFADPTVIQSRIEAARRRALRSINRIGDTESLREWGDTVCVGSAPSLRLCVHDRSYLALTDSFEQLVYMIDCFDGHRSRMRVRQNEAPYVGVLVTPSPRIHPPRQIDKRREALFSAKDMPPEMIEDVSRHHIFEMVEWVRFELMRIALRKMMHDNELFLLNDHIWQVRVVVMDNHRRDKRVSKRMRKRRRKYDDRHYHGHPRSHRGRIAKST